MSVGVSYLIAHELITKRYAIISHAFYIDFITYFDFIMYIDFIMLRNLYVHMFQMNSIREYVRLSLVTRSSWFARSDVFHVGQQVDSLDAG